MYQYQLYQLKVSSAFLLPGLAECPFAGNADVTIHPGQITPPPGGLPDTFYKPSSVANQDLYFLEVEDIARYQINGKREVLIDIAEGSSEKDALAFFFDTILTVLLLKHNRFVFHASAVKGEDGAVLICSTSGGGKSTLATLLMNQGFELIEDDRCLLHWDENRAQLMIRNYLPFLDLWKDLSKVAQKSGKLKFLHPVREGIQKLRFDASALLVKTEVPVQKIFLISRDNKENQIEQKQIKGTEKVRIAKNFTHLNHLIPFVSNAPDHFRYIAKMVNNALVFHINRSQLTSLKDFSQHIIQEIQSGNAPCKPHLQTIQQPEL